MKQFVQNVKNGRISVCDVPPPALDRNGILVRTVASLISAGTEKTVLQLAQKNLLGKARARPDLVRKVLDKLRRDGFLATFRSVQEKLNREAPLGYSACGTVTAVGDRASEFRVGQCVACAGAGFANHAEVNYVPRLLAAKVPDGVEPEAAAYATVGAIALQGIRNAQVQVGETVLVLGLGLLGQLTLQLLKSAGCRTVGLDPAMERVELARSKGADLALSLQSERVEHDVLEFTRGRGADVVIIAAATTSSAPVELAAQLARDRARIVEVGVTGTQLPRRLYYDKELTFVVSRSYGPGRYDPQYEQDGCDYPIGHVRWTENRNLEAFLDLVRIGQVRPAALTTHRFPIDEAEKAFELILTGRERYLGIILTYPRAAEELDAAQQRIVLRSGTAPKAVDTVGVSFLGAGSFAQSVLLPNILKCGRAELRGVATSSGLTARSAGKKFGFAFCASDVQDILEDPSTNALFIVTRHSQHAQMACEAMAKGKTVFVEKPLAITIPQVKQLCQVLEGDHPGLMVGFNRRFAPLAAILKEHVAGRGPLTVHYRCNAGPLAHEHWMAWSQEGGRIIGEACHFFDFFAFLTDSSPVSICAVGPGDRTSLDDAQVVVNYQDGSVCHLLYTSQGPPSFSKERVEVYGQGTVGVLDDFRSLHLERTGGWRKRHKLFHADKGHREEIARFLDAVRTGKEMPIPAQTLIESTLTSLAAVESVRTRQPIALAAMFASMKSESAAESRSEFPRE